MIKVLKGIPKGVELPRLSSIENSVEVIVFGEEPKLKSPVI